MVKLKNEKGQSIIEFALVLPMFIFLLFFIIDVAWINYQTISFDYAYRQASWKLSISDSDLSKNRYLTGYYIDNLLIDNIEEKATGIIDKNLSIANASLYLWSESVTEKYPGAIEYEYDYHYNYWRYMRIKGDFTYKIHPITPVGKILVGEEIVKTKYLEKERLLQVKNR